VFGKVHRVLKIKLVVKSKSRLFVSDLGVWKSKLAGRIRAYHPEDHPNVAANVTIFFTRTASFPINNENNKWLISQEVSMELLCF